MTLTELIQKFNDGGWAVVFEPTSIMTLTELIQKFNDGGWAVAFEPYPDAVEIVVTTHPPSLKTERKSIRWRFETRYSPRHIDNYLYGLHRVAQQVLPSEEDTQLIREFFERNNHIAGPLDMVGDCIPHTRAPFGPVTYTEPPNA